MEENNNKNNNTNNINNINNNNLTKNNYNINNNLINKIPETKRVCHKLDLKSEADSEAARLIKNKFRNAEEFLKIDDDIIIGKVIDTQKYQNLDKLKPYHIIGDKEEIIQSRNSYVNISPKVPKKSSLSVMRNAGTLQSQKSKRFLGRNNTFRSIYNNTNNDEQNIIKVSDEQIEQFFTQRKIKTANPKNRKELDNEIIRKIDFSCTKEMKGILEKQEKILEKKAKKENEGNNLAKFIAKKSQKNERELLMNRTDGFRIKNQCNNKILLNEPERPYEYGVYNNWIYSLRKNEGIENKKKCIEDKNKILRKDYILTHLDIRKDCDIAAIIYPNLIKGNDENIIKPNSASIKDFRKYANSRAVSSKLRKMNIDCEEFINGNDLNVRKFFQFFSIFSFFFSFFRLFSAEIFLNYLFKI